MNNLSGYNNLGYNKDSYISDMRNSVDSGAYLTTGDKIFVTINDNPLLSHVFGIFAVTTLVRRNQYTSKWLGNKICRFLSKNYISRTCGAILSRREKNSYLKLLISKIRKWEMKKGNLIPRLEKHRSLIDDLEGNQKLQKEKYVRLIESDVNEVGERVVEAASGLILASVLGYKSREIVDKTIERLHSGYQGALEGLANENTRLLHYLEIASAEYDQLRKENAELRLQNDELIPSLGERDVRGSGQNGMTNLPSLTPPFLHNRHRPITRAHNMWSQGGIDVQTSKELQRQNVNAWALNPIATVDEDDEMPENSSLLLAAFLAMGVALVCIGPQVGGSQANGLE